MASEPLERPWTADEDAMMREFPRARTETFAKSMPGRTMAEISERRRLLTRQVHWCKSRATRYVHGDPLDGRAEMRSAAQMSSELLRQRTMDAIGLVAARAGVSNYEAAHALLWLGELPRRAA